MPTAQEHDDLEKAKILDGDGTAPKAVPEDTSAIGEDGAPLSPKEHPGVQFISPGRDSGNGDAKVDLGGVGSAPQFVGLGKEELMRYANDPFWVRLRWFLFILFWLIWVGMLAAAIAIIVMAPKCTSTENVAKHLTNNGPYYQFALNSIASGDKFADLQQHVDDISKLGMKTVILSQFQKLTNLTVVDESFGSETSLAGLINAFKAKGIRVLLQISPNHVSKEHKWFEQHKGHYFVFEDAAKSNKSTWKTQYGEKTSSAWSPVGDGENNYLHQFREIDADLNYAKGDDVAKEMNGILKHWFTFNNGIFGFLLSDVSYLLEDVNHLDNQASTINQEGNREVLKKILDSSTWELGTRTQPFALLDVDDLDATQSMKKYTGDAMIPVLTDLAHLTVNFTADDLNAHISLPSVKNNFVVRRLGSPRLPRISNRFSHERADILSAIAFLLPGEVIVYYGDEIGISKPEGDVAAPDSVEVSVESIHWTTDANESKIKNFYKCLAGIHSSINQTGIADASEVIPYVKDGTFSFKRNKYVLVANLNEGEAELNLKEKLSAPSNGTLRCASPNTVVATDEIVQVTAFMAKGMSAYVIEFDLNEN